MSSSQVRATWQLPLQWPEALDASHARRSAATERVATERLLKAAILFAMLALTVFDRFGLRLTQDYSFPAQAIALYGVVAAALVSGAVRLGIRGSLGYMAVLVAGGASLIVNAALGPAGYVSASSFLLLIVLYAPFALSLRRGAVSAELCHWTLRTYVAFAIFLAAAGIAQYFAQFVYRPDWLFDFRPMIPEPIRDVGHWNTVIAADETRPSWEAAQSASGWIKSNGFFLREPSVFSIAIALGLVSELSLAKRKWVMAVLGLALLLSYSGSGLLCLAAGLLFPLGRSTLLRVLACALVAAAVLFFLGDALHLSFTLKRLNEFNSEGSSAYCRFILPGMAAFEDMDANAWGGLLGHGPGSMQRMYVPCGANTFAKALIEYGCVGTLALGLLLLGALRCSVVPLRVRVAAGVAWLVAGGSDVLFVYIISAMWPEGFDASTKPKDTV